MHVDAGWVMSDAYSRLVACGVVRGVHSLSARPGLVIHDERRATYMQDTSVNSIGSISEDLRLMCKPLLFPCPLSLTERPTEGRRLADVVTQADSIRSGSKQQAPATEPPQQPTKRLPWSWIPGFRARFHTLRTNLHAGPCVPTNPTHHTRN